MISQIWRKKLENNNSEVVTVNTAIHTSVIRRCVRKEAFNRHFLGGAGLG